MSRIFDLFKALDQFLFDRVDRLKRHPSYQRIIDQIGTLSESKQKLVNQISVVSITSLPILFLLFFSISNCTIRGDYETQRDILSTLNNISAKKTKLTAVGQQFFANYLITNKAELQNKIKQAINSKQIAPNKIKIEKFKKEKSTKNISEIKASLKFSDFSLNDLSSFLTIVAQKEKMKITGLSISKDKRNSLEGKIDIIHHGKSGK